MESPKHIQCVSELGNGRFGTVYLGSYDGQQVAVKKVPNSLVEPRGITVLSQLVHPNIIRLFYAESDQSFRYFALELCGGTLKDYCENKYQGFVPNETDGLLQMARGLCHIHLQNYIHKQVKPENILITASTSTAYFKISDFGLTETFRNVKEHLETLTYQAPELLVQINTDFEDNLGSRSADVFSLGCVFYYFLTKGSHPFGHKFFVVSNILMDRYNLNVKEPDGRIRKMIERMIQSEPGNRVTMPEVVHILEQLIYNSPKPQEGSKTIAGKTSTDTRPSKTPTSKENEIIRFCQFHPSVPKLICGLQDGTVSIVSPKTTGDPIKLWKHISLPLSSFNVIMCDWNFDGTILAMGSSDGTVVIYHDSGQGFLYVEGRSQRPKAIKWNPSGNLLVTASADKSIVLLNQWGEVIRRFQSCTQRISDLIWLQADKFACSDDSAIRIFQIDQTDPVKVIGIHCTITWLRWNAAEEFMICGRSNGAQILTKEGDSRHSFAEGSSILCVDCIFGQSTNSLVAYGTSSGKVMIFHVSEMKFKPIVQNWHRNPVRSVTLSPDGQLLASVDVSNMLKIWGTKDLKPIHRTYLPNYPSPYCLTWDNQSKVLAATCSRHWLNLVEL